MDVKSQIDNLLLAPPGQAGEEHRPSVYMTCVEPAFLSTAFGPEYMDKEVSQEMFLEAFRVGGPAAKFGV